MYTLLLTGDSSRIFFSSFQENVFQDKFLKMKNRQFETKKSKKSKVKNEIFAVALSIMDEVGFDNLTVRNVCEQANISIGMFYRHFGSKEDLLSFYYDKTQESFDDMRNDEFNELPIQEQLIHFYAWLTDFTQNLGLDFCQNFFNSKNQKMNTDVFNNKVIEITDSLLNDAINKGVVISNQRQPHDVSKDLCVIVKGVIFDWSAHEGKYDMPEFTVNLLRRCLKGIL